MDKHRIRSGEANGLLLSVRIRFSFWPWRWLSLLRLRKVLLRAQRTQNLDAESPLAVLLNESATGLLIHAQGLAIEDRQDHEAVMELIQLANGNRQNLKLAALAARQQGDHRKSYIITLTHRLLQAAITDSAVASISTAERRRLQMLDSVADETTLDD